jgi:hypothetical protein
LGAKGSRRKWGKRSEGNFVSEIFSVPSSSKYLAYQNATLWEYHLLTTNKIKIYSDQDQENILLFTNLQQEGFSLRGKLNPNAKDKMQKALRFKSITT